MAKKQNVNRAFEKLYTLAEDESIAAAVEKFGFRKPEIADGEEPSEAVLEQSKQYDSACKLMRHFFRAYVQKLHSHGVLEESILTMVGVLTDDA